MPTRVLLHPASSLDADFPTLPVEPGLGFGQAVGLASVSLDPVVLVAPARELQASISPALATFAVGRRLGHLTVVADVADSADADDVVHELTLRGFVAQTVPAHRLAETLARPATGNRPSLLVCRSGAVAAARPLAPFAPPPMTERAMAPITFDGCARDVGALALGIALEGRHAPVTVMPLAGAEGLAPALRAAARLGLPMLIHLAEDQPPDEILWSLRLCPGVDVWRAGDVDEVAALLADWLFTGGVRVVAIGPEPTPLADPIPSDLEIGAAIVAGADDPALTFLASGSEIPLALEIMRQAPVPARVVAVPSILRLAAAPSLTRRRLLGSGALVVLEAGVSLPWHAVVGADAIVVTDPADLHVDAVLAKLARRPSFRPPRRLPAAYGG